MVLVSGDNIFCLTWAEQTPSSDHLSTITKSTHLHHQVNYTLISQEAMDHQFHFDVYGFNE